MLRIFYHNIDLILVKFWERFKKYFSIYNLGVNNSNILVTVMLNT